MEFNKAYNRQEFVTFLQSKFLPEDFLPAMEPVEFRTKMTYSTQAIKLGSSEELDLVVYEIKHTSKNDARVSLSKEAFRMLADETEDRALVIFVPEDSNDNYRFSLIEITLETKEDSSRVQRNYSNPRRYSYFLGKGIAYYTPNKYLNEKGRVINQDDLRSRFSVEVLTKEFYNELSDWYAWAIKIIRFPNALSDKTDDAKYNNESAIRLITRLIFVWFLKQRHLIPDEFFDERYITDNLIEGFNPHAMVDLFSKSHESKYYKAILQNLFFAMLNSPITPEGSDELSERHFRKVRGDYDNNKLMRYESYFKNPQLFIDLANRTVPFLNGGLFDCLDEKDTDFYYDGFSDRESVKKSLIVPDYLFFGEEVGKNIDLSEWYGDKKKKKVSARGIIDILKRYNFTVEENTPFDQEVSLDPELLGKVFENLLASYNEDTKEIARKSTGSFYTPRNIVQYMVNESLVAHLKRTVGEELEPQFRQLIEYSDNAVELSKEQRKDIMQSLYNCKILDPACGSGAFPMGMLQQMVHILNRIDPDNTQWKEMMLKRAIDETSEAYRTASSEERLEMIADIERSFDENINRPDYARKLYLIENCIYGVDIQPIAIQISKLRFFISLVVDQKTNHNPADNFGIRPLPNLEAKFVAANTLIGLDKKKASLFDSEAIKEKEKELKTAKHKIFGAKTVRTKRKYRNIVNDLRLEIANMLKDCGAVGNAEAQQLTAWDMFDQNASSPFFDPEWMFGVKNGFDIVIANPPYNELRDIKKIEQDKYKKSEYFTFAQGGRINMFQFFYPFAIKNIVSDGICCMITQNSILAEESALGNRNLFFSKCKILKIDSFPERDNVKLRVFESAKMSVCICLLQNRIEEDYYWNTTVWKDKFMHTFHRMKISKKEVCQFYPDELIIPICDIDGWNLLLKMRKHAKFQIIAQTGEIDMTKYKSDFSEKLEGYRVVTGAQVLRYQLTNNPSQGKILYLLPQNVILSNDRTSAISDIRIVTQRITGVDSKIRIIATILPPNIYCANSTNYISGNKNRINLYYLLGILNSKCINFFFKQTSTNTNVTGKEIGKFPIPIGSKNIEQSIIQLVNSILENKNSGANTINQEMEIDRLVFELFQLTYDEVLIVDPQTPITREEYEKAN